VNMTATQLPTWWLGWLGLIVGVTTPLLQQRITAGRATGPWIAAVFGAHALWHGPRPVATANATEPPVGDHLDLQAFSAAADASSRSPAAALRCIASPAERSRAPAGGASQPPRVGASATGGHRPPRTPGGRNPARTKRGEPPRGAGGQPRLIRPDTSLADAPLTPHSPTTRSDVRGTPARRPHRRLPGRLRRPWVGKPTGGCRTASAPTGEGP